MTNPRAVAPSTSQSTTTNKPTPEARGPWWPYLAVDLALVILFAAIGRSSHGENLVGTLMTALPFLVGTAIGWLVVRPFGKPTSVVPAGVMIWLCTEVVGIALRAFTGQGIATSFIVVSSIALAVFLLGYRGVAQLVTRTRRNR